MNKHKQNIDLIPASITVYTKEDIERLGARNLLDLVRITPGFAELGDNNERIIGTRGTSSTSLQDILILINGHRISDVFTNSNGPDWLSLDYVEQIELMRGPVGSSIEITVRRRGQKKALIFNITREIIEIQSVKSKLIDNSIGYIRLTSFNENSSQQIKEKIKILDKNKNLKGYILDLRNNPVVYFPRRLKYQTSF